MSETSDKNMNEAAAVPTAELEQQTSTTTPSNTESKIAPPTSNSSATTPTSSVTGVPASRIKAPTNFGGSSSSVSKIGRLCSHTAPKVGPPPRDTKSMSRESDDNLSSINSQYTDHGSILTHDTEQFIIGQRVWVGGIRPGRIAYIGETHFAPGEWAGVVLDDPSGKNDGCVAGKRYFQCEPKRGIFSRLTRLTLAPLPGAQTPTSPLSKHSPDRSRTVSPTASIRSSFLRSPGKNGLTVGDRVIVSSGFGSRPGILRYLGETQFASGNWCGVELDEASGKNDGSVDGIRYFECKPKYGVFVPIAKVSLSPSSKKSRLSRTGSRESLTSIGTMNSVATTNTSRLRLNAQRKSFSVKPVVASTPKSQFSMQDLLREKQQHIEQLMIERDLDREDSQNTALQFQKKINELKTYIAHLERQLTEERKKAEDLQFSVDEATFCGDELNAQTQVYKEKIHELETKIRDLTSGKITSEEINATASAENDELKAKLRQQSQQFESQIAEQRDELIRLQENIKYLQEQNESLQKELVAKDESLEKFSLSQSGLENMRKELNVLKEEYEKERQQMQSDFNAKLEEKTQEIKRLSEENEGCKTSAAAIEAARKQFEDELRLLRQEFAARNAQVEDMNNQLAKLTAELSIKTAECVTLDELVKAEQLDKTAEQSQLREKMQEILKLKEELAKLSEAKDALQANFQTLQEEKLKLTELQNLMEAKLSAAANLDQERTASVAVLEANLKALRSEIESSQLETKQLNKTIQELQVELENEKALKESAQKSALEKESSLTETHKSLEASQETIVKLSQEQLDLIKNRDEVVKAKDAQIESLITELSVLKENTATLEGESSIAVQQMTAKISQLESQNNRLAQDLKNSTNTIEEQRQKCLQQEELMASKIAELKSVNQALETTTKLWEKLKVELEASLNKKQELEDELKKTDERNAQQQLDLGDLARKLETSNGKCETLESQCENLQQELKAVRSSYASAHNEVEKLNEELQRKQNEISGLMSSREEERIRLAGQLEELHQKLAGSSKDLNDLKEVLQKSKEEIAQKLQQIATLEEKTIKQDLLLSDNQRQKDNLLAKYEALVKQNESLQQDLTTLRTSSTDSSAELLKLSQELANKQKVLEELADKGNEERAALQSQLQASQQRIDGMCSQVETLTSELTEVSKESFSRFELLKQEQEKCGRKELEMADLQRKLDSFVAKCDNLEEQNKALQNDLNIVRQGSAGTNAEIVKLTEEVNNKQKLLQQLTDATNEERLKLEGQLQELKQSLQAQLLEIESLRSELKTAEVAKSEQIAEFEAAKKEFEVRLSNELQELKEAENAKQKAIVESFEAQLKNSAQSNQALDEAITSLQKQTQLLQDELLKSQLDFKSKEADLHKQIEAFKLEKDQLHSNSEKTQTELSSMVTNLKEENSRLLQNLNNLTQELREKESSLVAAHSEAEQLRIMQSNSKSDFELQIQKLQNALDLTNSDCEHKAKLLAEDKKKIEELKALLETLKLSHEQISATNAGLAEALEVLEQEKCETANIFELFEMESDQNIEKLIEKLSSLKTELTSAQQQLRTKESEAQAKAEQFKTAESDLQSTQVALNDAQNTILELKENLKHLQQANEELQNQRSDEKAKVQDELQQQIDEYKKIIDEMDESASEKSLALEDLKTQIAQVRQEKLKSTENEQTLKIELLNLQRKLELMEMEKTKEIVNLKQRISDLQAITNLKQNGATVLGTATEASTGGDSTAQINFLNSIIADMQKKNDTLKAKIEALEALPADFTKSGAFEMIAKRKPAPRVFCDICDEFDKHETEDCPLQASDDRDYSPPPREEKNNNDPANRKDRKLPEPRKYCESCEVFGHEAGECDDECY